MWPSCAFVAADEQFQILHIEADSGKRRRAVCHCPQKRTDAKSNGGAPDRIWNVNGGNRGHGLCVACNYSGSELVLHACSQHVDHSVWISGRGRSRWLVFCSFGMCLNLNPFSFSLQQIFRSNLTSGAGAEHVCAVAINLRFPESVSLILQHEIFSACRCASVAS